MRPSIGAAAFFFGIGLLAMALPAAAQERAMVPVTIGGATVELATITYKPAGIGPFATLILHRDSTDVGRDLVLASWFTARGWAVIAADRAQNDSCEPTLALAAADRALRDLDAITPALLA